MYFSCLKNCIQTKPYICMDLANSMYTMFVSGMFPCCKLIWTAWISGSSHPRKSDLPSCCVLSGTAIFASWWLKVCYPSTCVKIFSTRWLKCSPWRAYWAGRQGSNFVIPSKYGCIVSNKLTLQRQCDVSDIRVYHWAVCLLGIENNNPGITSLLFIQACAQTVQYY